MIAFTNSVVINVMQTDVRNWGWLPLTGRLPAGADGRTGAATGGPHASHSRLQVPGRWHDVRISSFVFVYLLFIHFKVEGIVCRPTRHVIDLLWTCMYSLAYPRCSPCRAQSFKISLPKDLECKGCTVRLIREAREWGKSYKFWSCADVDIVPRKSAVFALLIGISGFIFGA